MRLFSASIALAALLLATSAEAAKRVSPDTLAGISDRDLQELEGMAMTVDRARHAIDDAQAQVDTEKMEMKASKAGISEAKSRLRTRQAELKVAKVNDEKEALRVARIAVETAQKGIQDAKDALTLQKWELALAKEWVKVATARHGALEATLALREAEFAAQNGAEIDVATYDLANQQAAADLEMARQKLAELEEKVRSKGFSLDGVPEHAPITMPAPPPAAAPAATTAPAGAEHAPIPEETPDDATEGEAE